MVAGQREEFCQLAFALGYVQTWWYDAQSSDVAQRRQAFARISAMAPTWNLFAAWPATSPPTLSAIPTSRFACPPPASCWPAVIAGADYPSVRSVHLRRPEVRSVLSVELARHAALLCEDAIPVALRSGNPLEVLRMLLSWQRALPLPSLGSLPTHRMPRFAWNRCACCRTCRYHGGKPGRRPCCGLADSATPAVSQAAAAAIRLGHPKQDPAGSPTTAPCGWSMRRYGSRRPSGRIRGAVPESPSVAGAVFGPIANPSPTGE